MNQINQGNILHILIFFSLLSEHLLLLGKKKQQTKKHKTFHILPIPIVLNINKILYSYNNKIFHVNNL